MYKYNYSPSQLLKSVFPEYEWLPWKFDKCPQKFWENKGNQRLFMHWAAKELKINDMSDWYKISQSVNKELKIAFLFQGISQYKGAFIA